MTNANDRIHAHAKWVRPRAYSTSLANPLRWPRAIILRSSCGHMLGVGLVWKRQSYLTWKSCR